MKPNFYRVNPIEDDSNLARFYNRVFEFIQMARDMSAPDYWPETQLECNNQELCSKIFYELLLGERYFHGVIEKLNSWKETLTEYFEEYEGSWKYYACSNRLRTIKEDGGEESDYDEDGNLKNTGLTEDDLELFTVTSELVFAEHRNIALDTIPEQLETFARIIETEAKNTPKDIFDKTFHGEHKFWERDEAGDIHIVSEEENDMRRALRQVEGDDMIKTIILTADLIQHYKNYILSLDPFQDNKEELQRVLLAITGILNCAFEEFLQP